MGIKKTVSITLSILFGAVGILIIFTFFSRNGRPFEIALGTGLLFLAVFNLYLTVKFSKRVN